MRKYLTKKESAVALFLKLVHKLQRSEKELFDYLEQRLKGCLSCVTHLLEGRNKEKYNNYKTSRNETFQSFRIFKVTFTSYKDGELEYVISIQIKKNTTPEEEKDAHMLYANAEAVWPSDLLTLALQNFSWIK